MSATAPATESLVCEPAAIKAVLSFLNKQKPIVEVGRHDLAGVRVVIDLGKLALVDRGPGKNGDGTDNCLSNGARVRTKALYLFLERTGALKGAGAVDLLIECMADTMEDDGEQHDEATIPEEIEQALRHIEKQFPEKFTGKRKTAARCLGLDAAKIEIKVKKSRGSKATAPKRELAKAS